MSNSVYNAPASPPKKPRRSIQIHTEVSKYTHTHVEPTCLLNTYFKICIHIQIYIILNTYQNLHTRMLNPHVY